MDVTRNCSIPPPLLANIGKPLHREKKEWEVAIISVLGGEVMGWVVETYSNNEIHELSSAHLEHYRFLGLLGVFGGQDLPIIELSGKALVGLRTRFLGRDFSALLGVFRGQDLPIIELSGKALVGLSTRFLGRDFSALLGVFREQDLPIIELSGKALVGLSTRFLGRDFSALLGVFRGQGESCTV
jgi:hypothetical protein